MPEKDDLELARSFADLRRFDAAATPPFRRVLEGPRQARAGVRIVLGRVASAAVLTVALLLGGLLSRTALHRAGTGKGKFSLAQWASPTRSLLDTPGRELLDRVPALLEPAPAYADLERFPPRARRPTPPPIMETDGRKKGERS